WLRPMPTGRLSGMRRCLQDARFGDAVACLLPELDNLRSTAARLAETGRFAELQRLGQHASVLLFEFSPSDLVRWIRQAVDGWPSPQDQERVDAVGVLAEATLFTDVFEAAFDVADESIRLAGEWGLQASPWAWVAKALGAIWMNDPQRALDSVRAG